ERMKVVGRYCEMCRAASDGRAAPEGGGRMLPRHPRHSARKTRGRPPSPGRALPYTAAIASISSRKLGLARPRRMHSVLAGGAPAEKVGEKPRALGTAGGVQMKNLILVTSAGFGAPAARGPGGGALTHFGG